VRRTFLVVNPLAHGEHERFAEWLIGAAASRVAGSSFGEGHCYESQVLDFI